MSSEQHMKKLMSLREGFHVTMQCNMRQHFADRDDEEIHKRINDILREMTCV